MKHDLIDLQINGYQGINFSDPSHSKQDFIDACRGVLEAGVAAFLPTFITGLESMYQRNIPILAEIIAMDEFKGKVLGLHLEGPFISKEPGAVGAHRSDWCKLPDIDLLKQLIDLSEKNIKFLTIAPELPGACELTEFAVSEGIVVSAGHTLALSEDLANFAAAGGTAFTHIGNGLPNLLDRHNNPIWAALANDDLYVTMIVDGFHLPNDLIKTILKVKGAEKTIVISDVLYLAGCVPGNYTLDDEPVVLEKDGKLWKPELNCLAGSSVMMPDAMKRLEKLNLLSSEELMQVSYTNPLRLLGISE